MKKNLHFLFAVLFNICAMSVSAEITTVEAVSNSQSGIKEADYTATLAGGTLLGFQYDYNCCTNFRLHRKS